MSVMGRTERSSLDAWTTLAGLAAVTETITLGTMVSPATFRHPSVLAKSVVTVEHIAPGRIELGIGAGWNEAEHRAYGFPFYDRGTRLGRFEEQIEIVSRSWDDGPFDFDGEHYRIESLDALPKPTARPNLIVGGSGGARSAAIAARWANEYNTVFPSVDAVRERRATVESAWDQAGRDPSSLVFSAMTGAIVGKDDVEVARRAGAVMERAGETGDVSAWLEENSRAVGHRHGLPGPRQLGDAGRGRARPDHAAASRSPGHRDGRVDRHRGCLGL